VGEDKELRVHLVEIAIGILRADPKEDVTPARAWAIDVIERNSGVLFTSEDRVALLHKPVLTKNLDPTLSREGLELIEKWYQKGVPTVPER
jgi:hypothetical protein